MKHLVLLALFLLSLTAGATPPVPAEGMVGQVRVQGTRRIEEAAVLSNIGLRRGERLNPDKVRRDIKSVWGTGFFDDVIVQIAQREDGQGPRLHGMLRGPWAPGYRWLVGESEAWLRRLHARVDLDLTRRDVYDRPHGVTLWPRDWPRPGDDR